MMVVSLLPIALYSKTRMVLVPKDKATNVCVDTHLIITFATQPVLGTNGMIRVYDAKTDEAVDSIDISIPSGPTEPRTYGAECDYTKVPYDYTRSSMATNKSVRPGTPSGGAEANSSSYQLNIIGGFTDAFHFRPVIIHGNTATIYLHNNMLEYGHTYKVTIDKSVFRNNDFNGIRGWTFSTRTVVPTKNNISVNANGTADFCTVQGALDYVPDNDSVTYNIKVAEGDYEEIVYARNKKNVVIIGAGMDKTRVHYANCEVFNPHPLTLKTNEYPGTFPSRRAAFMLDNCTDITLKDMTIATDMQGQAEGLLINGERMAMYRVHIIGSGDAMQGNGTIYMEKCEMDGGGDTFLGRGSIFLFRCSLRNDGGPFTWIRNTAGHHGDVFVECSFSTNNRTKVDFGRCPENHGKSYPYAEQIMIRCSTTETLPEGWSAIGEKTAIFCEFDTRDLKTGNLVDTSARHKYSRQLDSVKDAEIIKNYSDPAYVLNGWTPVTECK